MLHLKSEIERRAAKVTSQDLKCLLKKTGCADILERDGGVLYHMYPGVEIWSLYTHYLASDYVRRLLDADPTLVANAE